MGIAVVDNDLDAQKLNYKVSGDEELSGEIELEGLSGSYEGSITLDYIPRTGTWNGLGDNVTISLSVPAQEYTVKFAETAQYNIFGSDGETPLADGGSYPLNDEGGFGFQVELLGEAVNKKPSVAVKVGGKAVDATLDSSSADTDHKYKYKIDKDAFAGAANNIIVIEVTLNDNPGVTWNLGVGYTVDESQSHSVEYNADSYEFKVKPDVGYEIKVSAVHGGNEKMEVSANDEIRRAEDDFITYTIKRSKEQKITKDIAITVVATKQQLTVMLESKADENCYSVDGVGTAGRQVEYGSNFTFSVIPKAGYPAPGITAKETDTDSNISVSRNGNQYTIYNVTKSITISITSPQKNQYTVQYDSEGVGYSLKLLLSKPTKGSLVDYGTKLTAVLTLKEGYTGSNPVLRVNGTEIDDYIPFGYNRMYATFTVTENVTITVEGVVPNTYEVTIPTSGEGYTVSSVSRVDYNYGDRFSFTVTLQEGYKFNNAFDFLLGHLFTNHDTFGGNVQYSLSSRGKAIKVSVTVKGNYDFAIDTSQVERITFTVAKPSNSKGDEYTFSFVKPKGDDSVSVDYGGSLQFSVKRNPGYKIESVTATVGGQAKQPTREGSTDNYLIENVTGEVVITVTASVIKYTVHYVYPDCNAFGLRFEHADKDVVYTVQKQSRDLARASSTGLNDECTTLTLDPPDPIKGFKVGEWQYLGSSISTIDVSNVEQDTEYTVSAQWELLVNSDNPDEEVPDAFKLEYYGNQGPQQSNDNYWTFKLAITTNILNAIGGIGNYLDFCDKVTVVAVGFAYSPTQFAKKDLANAQDKIFNWNGNESGCQFIKGNASEQDSIYTTYARADVNHLNVTINQTVFVPVGKKRYGYAWFHLRNNGEDLLVMSDLITLDNNRR